RDYAHVLVAMARASVIPARYVACYAPDVTPQDFHAVAQVFLANPDAPDGGKWHLVDATGMAKPSETVTIGVGRDASDVSFLTTFGPASFEHSEVRVERS
ncbi:MAG: transglutaminase-like domain-containing protein, partial [Pseudomonadota bacterium]